MSQDHDEGLVQQYLRKIMGLATEAAKRDVKADVQKAVEEAAAHFSIWKNGSNELGNLKRFNGVLALSAETAHSSQPERRTTFEYAAQLVGGIIAKREK